MRMTLLLITAFLMSQLVTAQNETLRSFAGKYADNDAVTHVTLRGGLLKLFRDKSGDNNNRTANSRLDALEIISFDDRSSLKVGDVSSLYRGLQAEAYEELMRIRSEGNWVQMHLLEEEATETITDVLLLIDGAEDFTLIHLTGRMTYEDLEKIDIDDDNGGEIFRRLPEDRGEEQP